MGIELLLQKLEATLYQFVRPQMPIVLVVNAPYGGQITYRKTPYGGQAGYGSNEQDTLAGWAYFSRKRRGASIVVDTAKFEKQSTKKSKGRREKTRQQEIAQFKAMLRKNYAGKQVPKDVKKRASALGIRHRDVKGVYW